MFADNCLCAALYLGLRANKMPCLTGYFDELQGSEAAMHEQIRGRLFDCVMQTITFGSDLGMTASLVRMLNSLISGKHIWDDVCFMVARLVGMNINLLSAVDRQDVLQVAQYSPGTWHH